MQRGARERRNHFAHAPVLALGQTFGRRQNVIIDRESGAHESSPESRIKHRTSSINVGRIPTDNHRAEGGPSGSMFFFQAAIIRDLI
jgi:hypothetical protein